MRSRRLRRTSAVLGYVVTLGVAVAAIGTVVPPIYTLLPPLPL